MGPVAEWEGTKRVGAEAYGNIDVNKPLTLSWGPPQDYVGTGLRDGPHLGTQAVPVGATCSAGRT